MVTARSALIPLVQWIEQLQALLNLLLENDENAAVLELHFPAGEFLFEKETNIAVGGADFSAEISNDSDHELDDRARKKR